MEAKASCCGFAGQGETGCRWSLLRRGGRCGKARALLLRVLRPRGGGLSLRLGAEVHWGVSEILPPMHEHIRPSF